MGKNYRKHKEWLHTPRGRASSLLNAYNHQDAKHNRGKGDLTSEWIVKHILFEPCAHCGKKGWQIIGCNRLDNSKPHTKDNVEPCCKDCNDSQQKETLKKVVYQYTLNGELVKVWSSSCECGKNGFHQGLVSECCNSKRKSHKGYKWSYNPL